MDAKHVLPLQPETFILLVRQLKRYQNEADIFEIDLDRMRVKGDLKVIQKTFNLSMIAKASSLDLLKRGVKANLEYVDVPHDLILDLEFMTLVKNKGAKIIRSYHNHENTPSRLELLDILAKMKDADLFKISTQVNMEGDTKNLLDLLDEPNYKDRLIVTGMGPEAKGVRIQAPLRGSLLYYAPITATMATAPGQLTQAELEKEWELL